MNRSTAIDNPETAAFCGVVSKEMTLPNQDRESYMVGKTLFKNYCASCHNKNMKDDMTGPALSGVEERWADYPREDLYNWIRNSQKMIDAKHPRAVELYKKWSPNQMNAFPNLTDEEIEGVLNYIEY